LYKDLTKKALVLEVAIKDNKYTILIVIEDIFVEAPTIVFNTFLTNPADPEAELAIDFEIVLTNTEAFVLELVIVFEIYLINAVVIETGLFLAIKTFLLIKEPIVEELINDIKYTIEVDKLPTTLDDALNDFNTFLRNIAELEEVPDTDFDINFIKVDELEAVPVIVLKTDFRNTLVHEVEPFIDFAIVLRKVDEPEEVPVIVFVIKLIITAVTRVEANLWAAILLDSEAEGVVEATRL
jgi:hypothetical protein